MKTISTFCFIFSLMISASIFAQSNNKISITNNFDWEWVKSAGGIVNEEGNALCHDSEGNIYICGHFNSPTVSFGSKNVTNAGSIDIYIAKYDASGNVLWAKSAGGANVDYATDISIDPSGGVYITGYYNSPSINLGAKTLIKAGSDTTTDAFIIKYDSSGNVLWAESIGGSNSDYGYSICSDSKSNTYITGYFDSPSIVFGGYTLNNSGGEDVFIVKFNSSGTTLWAKSKGGMNNDDGRGICADPSDHIFLIGEFDSPTITFDATTLTNKGDFDLFITKIDESGNVLWAKSAGGSSDDKSISLSADNDGNLYATGFYLSSRLKFESVTINNAGSGDIWIAKYDADGNVLWAKGNGGTLFDKGIGINVNANNHLYLTGYFISDKIIFGTDTLLNAGSNTRDFYLTEYDQSGNVIRAVSAGGPEQDFGFSVCTLGNDVYVIGKFESLQIAFDGILLTNANGSVRTSDVFLAKTKDSISNIAESDIMNPIVYELNQNYPNPFNPTTTIKYSIPVSQFVTLKVFDMLGREIGSLVNQDRIVGSYEIKFDASSLASGIYFYRLKAGDYSETKKLILMK